MKNVPTFYGRGAWDEEKMTFKDRTLCKMLQKAILKKDPNTYEPWMKALMSAVGKTFFQNGWVARMFITPFLICSFAIMMEKNIFITQ